MWATSARKLSPVRCAAKAGRAATAAGALALLELTADRLVFVPILVVLGAGAAEPDGFSSGRAFHIIFSQLFTQTDHRPKTRLWRFRPLRSGRRLGHYTAFLAPKKVLVLLKDHGRTDCRMIPSEPNAIG